MNLGSLLGFGGGNSGANFQAGNVNLVQPATQNQANNAYSGVQNGLNDQSNFVNAISGYNPLANQSSIYGQQQALAAQLAGQNGVQNQSNTFAQQQALAAQLQQMANGGGPNPAQAALNQNTAANVANQGALMASERGSNANVGLIAREAAQQGAATQQQAVGQAATLQANQQLGAISAEQSQQQALQQAAATQVAQQQTQQNALANNASNQVNQQATGINNLNNVNQNEQQMLLSSLGQYNGQLAGQQANINTVNAGIQNTLQQGQQGLLGGILGGVGSALGLANGGMIPRYSGGGMVRKYADGGPVDKPQSFAGKFLNGFSDSYSTNNFGNNSGAQALQNGFATFGQGLGNYLRSSPPNTGGLDNIVGFGQDLGSFMNGTPSASVPMMGQQPSPDMNKGGKVMKKGGQVPGKAKVKGDSLENDTQDAKLSPGEIVIPRSITMMKDAPQRAAAFVQHVLAQHKLCSGGMF